MKILSCVMGFWAMLTGANAVELKVGDEAPEWEMTGSDGKTYKLSDFKGKSAVAVAWFPKAFTGGWTAECKSFRENGNEISKYEVAYFTASCDKEETNAKFAKSLDLDYPILSDPTKKAAKAYGVLMPGGMMSKRWTFVVGKDGKILAIDKEVKAKSAGEDLAKRLGALKVETK